MHLLLQTSESMVQTMTIAYFKIHPWEKAFLLEKVLTRARRLIQNASEIFSSRQRIFLQLIQNSVEKNDWNVKATICQQNFLQQINSAGYYLARFIRSYNDKGKNKSQRGSSIKSVKANSISDILPVKGSPTTKLAMEVKDIDKSYVNSMQGLLPWQQNHGRNLKIIVE